MRSSLTSLRLLLSLLAVVLAALVCDVHANTPASTDVLPADSNATKKAKDAPSDDKLPVQDAQDDDKAPVKRDEPEDKPADDDRDAEGKAEPVESKVPAVISHIVEQAPAVELLNNGDISPGGDCSKDIKSFCPNVKPGASHLAECLQNRIEDGKDGAAEISSQVSKACTDAVVEYKMKLATNINYDTDMADACKDDAKQFCDDIGDVEMKGKIITCLRERKPNLSGKCRAQITKAQLAAAQDYRIDAQVYDFCKMDAYKFCSDVEPGSGRVNACLRDHHDEVEYDCRAALFRMDVENSDDIRLNTRLFKACLPDKRKFCSSVFPGNGRVAICLEEHMQAPEFTQECKAALLDRIESMSRDYRLDPIIRRECRRDISLLCSGQEESQQGTMDVKGRVMECLKRSRSQIKKKACKNAVARSIERSAKNVRFATSLAQACREDRLSLCQNLPPGDARVIQCLQEARDKLSDQCRANLFDHEVMLSESIDFNQPLKEACLSEVEDFCAGIPSGDARVIRCLQDGKRKRYSNKCNKELENIEKKMGQDYRFNHRLEQACYDDTMVLCKDVCENVLQSQPCGGKVLQCLTENKRNIKSSNCKKEVSYYIKMEVNNFGNDVILAEACRTDVEQFCSEVAPGEGRVHNCLRKRRSELSVGCRKEELKLEIEETKSFDLRTNLKKVCVQERNVFCSEVTNGQARVFRCLAHNLAQPDFGEACRREIKAKLMRRQENWKLDVTLRMACKEDAGAMCGDVDHDADHADVTRCLVKHHGNLTDSCQSEVSRATYMALNVYQEKGPISQPCAADAEFCADILSQAVVEKTGGVLGCLNRIQRGGSRNSTKAAKHKLSQECAELLAIAEPPDEQAEFRSNLQMISSINVRQKLATVGMWDHRKGVTITGYTALACFSALCTSVAMFILHLYKRWKGIRDDGYVQVVKRGDL